MNVAHTFNHGTSWELISVAEVVKQANTPMAQEEPPVFIKALHNRNLCISKKGNTDDLWLEKISGKPHQKWIKAGLFWKN